MKKIILLLSLLFFASTCKKDNPVYLVNASADSTQGEVIYSAGDYGPGSSVTFTANPNEHYNFLNWVDQSSGETYTDNQLTLQVEGDLSLEAVFKRI